MDKSIVIGVGGTGLEAIRSLRRRVVEERGGLDAIPQLGFLYIDTDPAEVQMTEEKLRDWQVLGTSIAMSEEETCILQAPSIGPIVKNISSYPHIEEWLPVDQLSSIDQAAKDTPGASQIRPLGRLVFTLKTQQIQNKFLNTLNRLKQGEAGGKTQVYVVCSLSGGTGSGMFLDLAYRIKEWTNGNATVVSFLVFPDLQINRGKRYLANAYAALLELNHFNIGQLGRREDIVQHPFLLPGEKAVAAVPFDSCYILGTRNEANVEISLAALPQMIAHFIHLCCDSSFSKDAEGLLNNGRAERTMPLRDPFTGSIHSQNFFTFGLSSIQYPIEQITEIFSYRIAADLFADWLKDRSTPGNVNQRVQNYLQELKLTDDYFLGNKDFFGGKNFESYEREVEAQVNEFRRMIPETGIVAFLADKQRQYIDQFRSVGVLKFFQDKKDDLAGAVQEVSRALRARLSSILTDPELGHGFATQFLDELLRILGEKQKNYVDTLNGLPAKEKGTRNSLAGYYNTLTEAEHKLLFKGKAVQEALGKAADALRLNLAATIGLRAYEFGHAVLTAVSDEVRAQREAVVDWRSRLKKLQEELAGQSRARSAHLLDKGSNTKEFNGAILFDVARTDALYGSFDIDSAKRAIAGKLLARAESGALGVPYGGKDMLDMAYGAAIDWLGNVSRVRVTDRNVADKLIEDYPDPVDRKNLMTACFKKAAPFMVTDGNQKDLLKGLEGGYEFSQTTEARIAAMIADETSDKVVLETARVVRKEIASATGLSPSDVRKIIGQHQILFLQEWTAFPLRLLTDVSTLRAHYLEYQKKDSIPLHIRKRFDPPLGDLFLTTDEEIRRHEDAQEAFVTARSETRIRVEQNRRDEVDEIRYRYTEAGSETFARLGAGWDDAFAFYMGDEKGAQELRTRVTQDMLRLMKSLDTQTKRRPVASRLYALLDDLKRTLELGEENPVYQRYDSVRKRIVRKYNLPVDVAAIETTVPPQAAGGVPASEASAEGDALVKFQTLARTALRNSNGKLTPAMEDMLRSKQGKLGLTVEQATALIAKTQEELSEPREAGEYRNMFEAFFEDGEIDDSERATLVEQQVELGLSDSQVQAIESQVKAKRSAR